MLLWRSQEAQHQSLAHFNTRSNSHAVDCHLTSALFTLRQSKQKELIYISTRLPQYSKSSVSIAFFRRFQSPGKGETRSLQVSENCLTPCLSMRPFPSAFNVPVHITVSRPAASKHTHSHQLHPPFPFLTIVAQFSRVNLQQHTCSWPLTRSILLLLSLLPLTTKKSLWKE